MKKLNSQPGKLGYRPAATIFVPLWPHLRTERRIKAIEKSVKTDGTLKYPEIHKTLTAQMLREKKEYDKWKSMTQMKTETLIPPTTDTKPTS